MLTNGMIEVNYYMLHPNTLDVCLDVADKAKTPEECWKLVDQLLQSERITELTYHEIKRNVTFSVYAGE